MKASHAFLLGLIISLALVTLTGCSVSKPNKENTPQQNGKPPPPALVAKEPFRLPFLGDDIKGASQAVLAHLSPLYRISYVFLGASGVVGVFLGLRIGLALALGGLAGVASAILFSEFPRAVLVPAVLGALFLTAWGVIWFRRLWGGYNALKVLAQQIEELDNGPQSAGRKLKKKIEESGAGNVVRQGIGYIKNLMKRK